MSTHRNYSDYSPKECAVAIAREVIFGGRSDGWTGGNAELEAVAAVLTPLQIVYVDDMLGRWGLRSEPRTTEPAPMPTAPRTLDPREHALAVRLGEALQSHMKHMSLQFIAPDHGPDEAPHPPSMLTPQRFRSEVARVIRDLFSVSTEMAADLAQRYARIDFEQRRGHVDTDAIAAAIAAAQPFITRTR